MFNYQPNSFNKSSLIFRVAVFPIGISFFRLFRHHTNAQICHVITLLGPLQINWRDSLIGPCWLRQVCALVLIGYPAVTPGYISLASNRPALPAVLPLPLGAARQVHHAFDPQQDDVWSPQRRRGTGAGPRLRGKHERRTKSILVVCATVVVVSSPARSPPLQGRVVRRDGVLRSVLRGIFWPFGIVVRPGANGWLGSAWWTQANSFCGFTGACVPRGLVGAGLPAAERGGPRQPRGSQSRTPEPRRPQAPAPGHTPAAVRPAPLAAGRHGLPGFQQHWTVPLPRYVGLEVISFRLNRPTLTYICTRGLLKGEESVTWSIKTLLNTGTQINRPDPTSDGLDLTIGHFLCFKIQRKPTKC